MMHSAQTETFLPETRDNPQSSRVRVSTLRRLHRGAIETLCAGVVILTLLVPAHAEEAPAPDGAFSPPAAEIPAPAPAAVDPVTIDPFIELRGSVWRTKAGIVFLKTPVG